MKKITILLYLLLVGSLSFAQQFPFPVIPVQENTVSGGQQIISTATDTLWIMKNSQMKKAVIAAKENKVLNEQLKVNAEKISLLEKKCAETDSLRSIMQKDRDFYIKSYKTCDASLTEAINKYAGAVRFKKFAFIGMGATFVAGFFIARKL